MPLLTVVVPICSEEAALPELYQRLTAALTAIVPAVEHTVLFVNDGSRDNSLSLLRSLAARDARVEVLSLSRNFGQQQALTAGLDHAAGDAVVLMDGDLQDPPEAIAGLVAAWRAGAAVVYGVRRRRLGESWTKLAAASFFYRLLSRLADTPLPRDSGDFRLLDRRVVEALRHTREPRRYLRGLVAWVGFRQVPYVYDRDPRHGGRSKFTWGPMLRLGADALTAFSERPLRWLIGAGVGLSLAGVLTGFLTALHVLGMPLPWQFHGSALLAAVLGVGGLQLVGLGVVGLYVGHVAAGVRQRPLYVVAERITAASTVRSALMAAASVEGAGMPSAFNTPGTEVATATKSRTAAGTNPVSTM